MEFPLFYQKKIVLTLLVASCGAFPGFRASGERINQEGRILGPAPAVTNSILFNTREADAAVSAMQIFPPDNPWNEDISRRPALTNSDVMIQQIMSDLLSTRRTLRAFYEMNFVLVPDDQPLVPIDFFNYADESDPSPYPIPLNLPIETWPHETGPLTLQQWQEDINNDGGDRHAVIVQPGNGFIWETWLTKLTGTNWEASNGAKFDLKGNALRPAAWTSGDAAGLPMFPALPRYDECERGMEHRQASSVAGGPRGRAQRVALQIELRAVRRLPVCAGEFRQPRFPDEPVAGLHDDGVTVAAVVIDVLLPLLKCQRACFVRPRFYRQIQRNRIWTRIGFVRVVEKIDGHERLIVRHQHKIHFVERAERSPRREQVGHDLLNHHVGIGQRRPA